MAERTVTAILEDLRQTQQTFLNVLQQISGDMLYQYPAGEEWCLAVVLAHITEARHYYAGEVQKVLAQPGTTMGRTVEHAGRLQSIETGAQASFDELRAGLIAGYQRLLKTLMSMSDSDLQLVGHHVVAGPQTLADFIERFMVAHDQAHAQQATTLLAAVQPASKH